MPRKVNYKNFQLFIRANFKNKHLLNFKSIRITPKTSYSPHAKKNIITITTTNIQSI